jgi:hypothetical protein
MTRSGLFIAVGGTVGLNAPTADPVVCQVHDEEPLVLRLPSRTRLIDLDAEAAESGEDGAE